MPLQDFSANSIREAFLSFFEGKGHKRLPSSSLLPENDPTVLFTTAGMQQFKRYYLFPDEAPASKVTTCQKCVRTGDIDEVGDATHLTFFEMLGNFSFGYRKAVSGQQSAGNKDKQEPYYKEEAIGWAWEFLTEELGIDQSRIYATYFKGENGVPEDVESLEILKKIEGLQEIKQQGFEDNFWSLGTEGSPGGPTVEFYVLSPEALAKGGDGVEVWNLVFNEFVMKNGVYEPSELKGVDTGMGLERLVAKLNGAKSVYLTDMFDFEHKKLHEFLLVESPQDERVILDHIRSAVFMINDGVEPSNKGQGYILRRLIRRAVVKARNLKIDKNFSQALAEGVFETYPNYEFSKEKINSELEKEESKFRATLEQGLNEFNKTIGPILIQWERQRPDVIKPPFIPGSVAFNLYQSFGFPLDLILEIAQEKGLEVDVKEFNERLGEHQEKSRTASAGMFKGGLADNKIETTRLHTTAHLLLAALRHEIGPEIEQKGSNITEERLRFDFNYPEKLSEEKIKKVEDLVNLKIEEALPVVMQELSLEEAKNSGATGSFHDKYGDKVKIFTIGDLAEPFSREICGGPHVENTSELGHFKIIKEESSSYGIRRIKAILS